MAKPAFVPPMLATLVAAPFDDPDWLFEVKWDGYRVEAVIRDGKARIWTRRRLDAATYFPQLAGEAPWIEAREAIVDGEVVALDDAGRPRFSLLQDRTGIRTGRTPGTGRPGEPAPIVYQVFDLLHLDGQSLLSVPLEERKRLLRGRLRPHVRLRRLAAALARQQLGLEVVDDRQERVDHVGSKCRPRSRRT